MTIFASEVGDEQSSQWVRHPPEITRAIDCVRCLILEGHFSEALKILEPLLDAENPEAQFIASSFSRDGESPEEFDKRRVDFLTRAADQDYPPALYSLGAYYDSESEDQSDCNKAAQLFRRAALLGHAHSQWIYGLDLLYGAHGIEQDTAQGIAQIIASAEKKFQGALETISRFHDRGEFGFALDPERAALFRARALDHDTIGY